MAPRPWQADALKISSRGAISAATMHQHLSPATLGVLSITSGAGQPTLTAQSCRRGSGILALCAVLSQSQHSAATCILSTPCCLSAAGGRRTGPEVAAGVAGAPEALPAERRLQLRAAGPGLHRLQRPWRRGSQGRRVVTLIIALTLALTVTRTSLTLAAQAARRRRQASPWPANGK